MPFFSGVCNADNPARASPEGHCTESSVESGIVVDFVYNQNPQPMTET